ncbi:hypothetical protein BWI17_18290 [Betaproteobacteria bacterium GR16-43]|nr:hypothetical protein BWI17_18290 [Betaproteobacteria bacterium GR16-43]
MNNAKKAAVVYTFQTGDDPNCPLVRRDVDDVLAMASDHAIKSTTPNNHLLSAYMWPEVIARLYIALNSRLAKYPNFTPFDSGDFDRTTTIGDAREGAYKHCGELTCSSV